LKINKKQFLPASRRKGTWIRRRGAWGSILGVHDTDAGEPEATPQVRFLAFSSRFRLFFRLETPKNLEWIFFTLYFLQQLSKTLIFNSSSLVLHMMSCFDDLHDSSLQNTQNTCGVAWFRIKLNYNDSKAIQYVPQSINNSSESHLSCFQMQRISTKNIAKMSYDALSSLTATLNKITLNDHNIL